MFGLYRIGMVVTAAGIGSRMKSSVKKQYMLLKDKEILRWTLESLVQSELLDEIVVVVGLDEIEEIQNKIAVDWNLKFSIKTISGGLNRQESVCRGLKAFENVDYVFVHDGVRPFVKAKWLEEMLRILLDENAKLSGISLGVPSTDTLKQVDYENVIKQTLNRDQIWSVQTPQLFKWDELLRAHSNAQLNEFVATDDASLIEADGGAVKLVFLSNTNIKITNPFDIEIAKAIISLEKEG